MENNRLLLRRVYIDNYKCMRDFNLSFGELTLLLGKNGCGKSAVFEAIHKLHCFVCRDERIGRLFSASSLDRRNVADNLQSFGLEVGYDENIFYYEVVIEHERTANKSRVQSETLTLNGKPLFQFRNGEVQLYKDDYSEGPKYPFDWGASGLIPIAERGDNLHLIQFRKWLRGVVMLVPNPFNMEGGAKSDSDVYLDSDGKNFAAWYRGMLQENPAKIVSADEHLREVLPGYNGLKLSESSGESHRDLLASFVVGGKNITFRFDELSAGQRVLIALYMLIFGGNAGRILLLDEPDNFVMLPEIQPLLGKMEDECGDTLPQIAFISHHPESMDFISPRQMAWIVRDDEGSARVQEYQNKSNLHISQLSARGMTP